MSGFRIHGFSFCWAQKTGLLESELGTLVALVHQPKNSAESSLSETVWLKCLLPALSFFEPSASF
jgi:hypothetical protein